MRLQAKYSTAQSAILSRLGDRPVAVPSQWRDSRVTKMERYLSVT